MENETKSIWINFVIKTIKKPIKGNKRQCKTTIGQPRPCHVKSYNGHIWTNFHLRTFFVHVSTSTRTKTTKKLLLRPLNVARGQKYLPYRRARIDRARTILNFDLFKLPGLARQLLSLVLFESSFYLRARRYRVYTVSDADIIIIP